MTTVLKAAIAILLAVVAIGYLMQSPEQRGNTGAGTGAAVAPSVPTEAHRLSIGDSGTIDNGLPIVMLSTTKDGYDDISNGMAAKDKVGLRDLILTGKAFTVKAGTHAKVIEVAFALRRVRILDGEKVNAAGWLPFEWVK